MVLFSLIAISAAATAYVGATRVLFPLINEKHHDHHHTSGNGDHHDNSFNLHLLLLLSCAVSTCVPGLFTLSVTATGFALGFGTGSAVAGAGVLIGLVFSFELGRTVCRERASALVASRFPSAHSLSTLHPSKAIWISWFLPVPLAIKIFFWASCSNVTLLRFILSASVVAVPQVGTLALIGDQAATITEKSTGMHEKVFFGLGIASVCVVGAALSRFAQRAVKDASVEDKQQP